MPHYLTLDDVEVDGLTVLVRSDLNVPIEDRSSPTTSGSGRPCPRWSVSSILVCA